MSDRYGDPAQAQGLIRRLGTMDAVVIGLGSMIGAGVFAAFAPAAAAAGTGLLIALAVAGIIAYCNAASSAALAARYPTSGGTYVYGRERLGHWWGFIAGWGFLVGKIASCAAMALTFASYTAPAYAKPLGATAVIALAAVNYFGVTKTARLARILLAATLLALTVVLIAVFGGGQIDATHLGSGAAWTSSGPLGVLQAAGLLFFAFAGYARIATLGEEVRNPERTIPRAIPIGHHHSIGTPLRWATALRDGSRRHYLRGGKPRNSNGAALHFEVWAAEPQDQTVSYRRKWRPCRQVGSGA